MSSVEDFVTISVEHYLEITNELEVYKKALELLAKDSTNTYLSEDKQDLIDYYLQKAREEWVD